MEIEEEIRAIKQLLNSTNQIVLRVLEGVSSKEDYADIFTQRAEWYARLDELEAQQANA